VSEALLQVRGLRMEFPLNATLARRLRRNDLEVLRAVDGVDLEI